MEITAPTPAARRATPLAHSTPEPDSPPAPPTVPDDVPDPNPAPVQEPEPPQVPIKTVLRRSALSQGCRAGAAAARESA